MKFFNRSKVAVVTSGALMLLSLNVSADSQTFGVGFTTVPDITLTSVTPMDLGEGIFLPTGSACDLGVSAHGGTGYAGDTTMKLARGTGNEEAEDVGYQILGAASTDCAQAGTATGTAGFYEITAVPGGTVKVTVSNVTGGTFFNFVVAGCIGDYDGSGDGDDCLAITPGTPVDVRVADSGDTVGNTGTSGAVTPGKTLIAVGGVLTTAATHTSDTDMTENFNIDVTY